MSGYPYRLQAILIVLLALAWIVFCSPWTLGLNGLLAAFVIGTTVFVLMCVTRRTRARQHATAHTLEMVECSLRDLPPDLRRNTPLIIAMGDPHAMTCVWGDGEVRMTDAALWVRCESSSMLMHLADALKRWRGGQGPDAVAVLIAADHGNVDAQGAAVWKSWRSALSAAGRAVGYALPVCMAVYAESAREKDASPWFGVSGATVLNGREMPAILAPRLEQYVRRAPPTGPETRARRAALLDALIRWASTAPLLIWDDGRAPWRVMAFGVATVPGFPASQAPFGQFVAQATGLGWPATDRRVMSRYPLPDQLLTGLPRQPLRRAWPRALVHALMGLTLFFVAGAAASAWQNRALMQRLAGHMARYQGIAATQDAARLDALVAIKRDRDDLERYASAGVPMRLGFGLYRGGLWLSVVNRLIASYQPPAPPPSMIELDSMSLFRSGSAVLNPGSNRLLVASVEMVKTHPDKRVLIAGHTDSVGLPAANLKLSEARAAGVRDWLIDASGLSPTRFAIQGYGDTRPKASNNTDAGRAENRRVEITLIPDCRDGDGSRSTQGHLACS